jgi:hypothetical protein
LKVHKQYGNTMPKRLCSIAPQCRRADSAQ